MAVSKARLDAERQAQPVAMQHRVSDPLGMDHDPLDPRYNPDDPRHETQVSARLCEALDELLRRDADLTKQGVADRLLMLTPTATE